MFEIFLVSIIYWTSLLVLFIWLNRRLSALKERIAFLEAGVEEKEEK
ncbi:MAG: hypothetical protein H8D26_07070 [Methanomicrobia archaeon]|nr:hypothetical protein [Methanomicrobia archaeon]